jgi:predicted nucleic acid-binding protein
VRIRLRGDLEMTGKNIIYWDSCIFISWLKNEPRDDPDDLLGIEKLITLFDMGQIDIATSAITFIEVLENETGLQEFQKFRQLFSRKNCFLIDVDKKIAELSHDIRNFYKREGPKTLSTPDCIHLATAIMFQCSEFYTFDGESNSPGKLLTLEKPIAGEYNLNIQKPKPDKVIQPSLSI